MSRRQAQSDPDLLDRVRLACAEVAARARWVRIDEGRLAACAAAMPPPSKARRATSVAATEARRGSLHSDRAADRAEAVAALEIQLDAVNFGSGWHPVLRKRPGLSGARTVAASYRDHADAAGVPTAAELAEVPPATVAVWVGQDADGPADELVRLFTSSLNELGRFVLASGGGRFSDLVASAGGSAAALASRLAALATWRDEPTYDGVPVPLYKRAQIVVADLHRAFGGDGLGWFGDVDRLTMFADNLVPHVLRVDGVLVVEPALAARIDAGELLVYGSPEEVELRAVAVEAVERLAAATGVAPRLLDELLWHRGGEPRYKALPRHRCRTTAY